jgi:soluble lytic murein transglycosylase-like protein
MTYKTPLIVSAGLAAILIFQPLKNNNSSDKVVKQVAGIAVTGYVTPSPTLIPSPTPTITPRPTKKPTPTPKPQPEFTSEQIYFLINKYSSLKGVDPNVIRHIAICESGFNPKARSYIYGGLFQYAPATWRSFRKMMGENPDTDLRFNAEEAIKTTVYIVSLGRLYHWPNCAP